MPFIINDESKKNSYGFRVKNAGINLERFKSNPVMLDSHWGGSTQSVIGKWTNIRIEGQNLMADADFDPEDELAQKIKGKVDRGYLKGTSMGLTYNRAFMEQEPDGSFILTECELVEVSIVSVPSNANAIKLYAELGVELSESEIKLSIQEFNNQINNPTMNKVTLSVATLFTLGLPNTDDNVALSAAIEKTAQENADLKAKLSTETTAKEAAELKLKEIDESKALSLIDTSIKEGRINADQKEEFLSLAKSNFATAEKILSALPKTEKLTGKVTKPLSFGEVKTDEDFQKLTEEQQLAFKAENPEAYQKMFA
jgi:HK97 family phage prohead protease